MVVRGDTAAGTASVREASLDDECVRNEVSVGSPSGSAVVIGSSGPTTFDDTVTVASGIDNIELDEDDTIDISNLPGGAVGSAAIYTDRVKGTHIIRKVMLRRTCWVPKMTLRSSTSTR